MKRLTSEAFNIWLETYSRASRKNDPQVSAELFAQDAKYFETPLDEPLIGREAIRKYWEKGAQNLKDKRSVFEILGVKANLGIARWQSNFTVIESNTLNWIAYSWSNSMMMDCAKPSENGGTFKRSKT